MHVRDWIGWLGLARIFLFTLPAVLVAPALAGADPTDPPALDCSLQAGNSGAVQVPATLAEAGLLPCNIIVPLGVVNRYFPEVTIETSMGPDATALGNPVATRAVMYGSSDGAQRVTISVDRYPTAADASAAYQQAVSGSQAAPGFSLLPAPDLGEQAYAGTSTNGEETHVGLGSLNGELIVAATIAGFDATSDNIAKLIGLAREEQNAAQAGLASAGGG
jgi:hypothetical protein